MSASAFLPGLSEDAPVRRCHSAVLDEEVMLVADDAQIPVNNRLVVFRQTDLRWLCGQSSARLRTIHTMKRIDQTLISQRTDIERNAT